MSNFLWDSHAYLGKWWFKRLTEICGFGIGSICLKNKALLGKWWWHFQEESDSLMCRVIISKYGVQENI